MKLTKTVLFVAYGGGHMNMILPVIEVLKNRSVELKCVLLALTTGYSKAVKAGASPLGYRDFINLADVEAVNYWGHRLHSENSSPDVSEAESIAYLGINYLDLIEQYGEEGAAKVYSACGRSSFRPMHFMRRLLNQVQPNIVVATNSPRSERTVLDEAAECGIPSVGMVDLFGQDGDRYLTHSVRPTWTCVISESVKQRFIRHGFHPKSVFVTGNPAFDGLCSVTNRDNAMKFMAHQCWQGLSPILWAGHIEPTNDSDSGEKMSGHKFPMNIEATLREFVSARKELALIVRYHPSEWHTFPRLPDNERVHFSIPSDEPIHPIILAAKAVVLQTSTVGLEAYVAGKPVVSLEHSPSVKKYYSLANMGISTPCYSTQDLPSVLEKVMSNTADAAKHYTNDGRSAERVADVITAALGL